MLRFVQKEAFWGNRQKIVCWPLQMNTAKGKRNLIWHHATSRCANETTWKRGKNHMFQERTNINQWIYEQDVDVISHVPAHTKCTWKPFLRSDNPPVRMYMYVYVCIRMYMCVYVCTCMYTYVNVCICMYMYVYICICMCMYVFICICMYMYVYVCIYICTCMYMYEYVCKYM